MSNSQVPSIRGLGRLLVGGLLILALGMINGGAWATPQQDPLRQTVPPLGAGESLGEIQLNSGGTVTGSQGDSAGASVTFDPNTQVLAGDNQEPVAGPINVVITDMNVNTIPSQPGGLRFLGKAIQIELYKGTTLLTKVHFNPPILICFPVTDADIRNAGGSTDNMAIDFFDTTLTPNQWVALPTQIIGGQACVRIDHLTLFALVARVPTSAPTTGGDTSALTGYLLWGSAGLAVLLAAFGVYRFSRRAPR